MGICFKHHLLKENGICEACEKGEDVIKIRDDDPRDTFEAYWPNPASDFLREIRGY